MPALQEAPPQTCPKCSGSIIVERDWHGTYGSCIMCGYVHEVLTRPPIDLAAEEAALPQRQRRRQPSHGKTAPVIALLPYVQDLKPPPIAGALVVCPSPDASGQRSCEPRARPAATDSRILCHGVKRD